jgi:hypothetical protein
LLYGSGSGGGATVNGNGGVSGAGAGSSGLTTATSGTIYRGGAGGALFNMDGGNHYTATAGTGGSGVVFVAIPR